MFERSREELQGHSFAPISWICGQLDPFRDDITSVLEIGSSNGAKLRQICRTLDCAGSGIDPSQLAVDDGNAKGDLDLRVGTSAVLPFEANSFDVVYFGFCMYLLDRVDLLPSVAEANRVLKSGGFLVVTDFDPAHQHKRAYHHTDGVFTHKQDYSACFNSTGMYHLVAKRSFSINGQDFAVNPDDRVSTVILYKEAA
uniref:class I SAM-dependent methyltransferase n=1 Tax=Polaromonas sp. TaxID=1869339 RepID=UPI004037461C